MQYNFTFMKRLSIFYFPFLSELALVLFFKDVESYQLHRVTTMSRRMDFECLRKTHKPEFQFYFLFLGRIKIVLLKMSPVILDQ